MALIAAISVILQFLLYVTVLWIFPLFTYRALFHPLRKYPGPLLARFSDAYAGYHAIVKYPHLDIYKNIQQYGSVYRAGPNRLIFHSLTAIQDIYMHPHITKGRAYRHSRWMDKPNIFDTPDRYEHRRKRQAMSKVVSDKALRAFEPTMSSQINIFLRKLLRTQGNIINMTINCKRLSVDIIGYLSFGYELQTQTEVSNRLVPEAMNKAIYIGNIFFNWPTMGLIGLVIRWLGRKRGQKFYQAVQRMITARQAEPKNAKADFYSIALKEQGAPGEGLNLSELWGEAIFFVLAGGTTVATSMCAVLFHLVRHPLIYDRLAAEIRKTFRSGSEIRMGPKLSACKFLRAVIEESIRLSPPSLTPLWREPAMSSTEPFIVDGNLIPRGTQVSIHPWSLLHDPEYFPDPFSFKPERWLDEEDSNNSNSPAQQEVRAKMYRAQVNFGLGDRNCTGKSMAYIETSLVIARALWYFDFDSAPGQAGKLGEVKEDSRKPWAQADQFDIRDILIADHDGPNLVFRPREQYWRELEV